MKYKILKCFASIRMIWPCICEIKIREIKNDTSLVKYTTLENNHLYGIIMKLSIWPDINFVLATYGKRNEIWSVILAFYLENDQWPTVKGGGARGELLDS